MQGAKESTCIRCGWSLRRDLDREAKLRSFARDAGYPPIPLDMIYPHSRDGTCPSPFYTGQRLYWDLEGAGPDGPPMLVRFERVIQIESASWCLDPATGVWAPTKKAEASYAKVTVDLQEINQQHKDMYGPLNDLTVRVDHLTPELAWPVYEIG